MKTMANGEDDGNQQEQQQGRRVRRRTVEAKSTPLLSECPKDAPFIASYMPNKGANFIGGRVLNEGHSNNNGHWTSLLSNFAGKSAPA